MIFLKMSKFEREILELFTRIIINYLIFSLALYLKQMEHVRIKKCTGGKCPTMLKIARGKLFAIHIKYARHIRIIMLIININIII